MTTINISLPEKMKKSVDKLIKQGYYVSFSDAVRTALRDLNERSSEEHGKGDKAGVLKNKKHT